VGKAINLRKRVSSYFQDKNLGQKTKQLVSLITKIETISVSSEVESFLLEERLIKKFHPKFNISLKDAKTYPYVEINVKDDYPSVLLTRKIESERSLYFGPYTSVNSLRTVLKLLRRIFPYVSVRNHPNYLCLNYHLGLCPCPNVTNNPDYKKNIKHIVDFLEGKTGKVVKDLEKERDVYSKNEYFEEASKKQQQLDQIKLITSPFYKPFEYETNPNLRQDVIKSQLLELELVLNQNNTSVKYLERIECFDVSNIQGRASTASMVVFKNGEKDSSSYRRFKIRGLYNNKPNDFAMMKEVLLRRFKHTEWQIPNLLIVDGGKGQVSIAKRALFEMNMQIPLIGLAKREETIISEDLKEIRLPKDSKALQLIMRIRDEAHRFAITYHRKLRDKLIYD
jgi:excinuclease ABC subunit C